MQDPPLDQLAHMAVRCHARGMLREAEALYRELLAARPRDPNVHYNLGCALQDMGRLTEALAAYESAASFRPDYAEAHSNSGMVLYRLDRLPEAADAFGRAVALRPDYADAHYHLGRLLEDLGRPDEAQEEYHRAVSCGSGGLAVNRGSALRKLGRLDEAVAAFQDALHSRESAELRLNLGAAYQEKGELDRAMAEYRRAIELRPQFAEAYTSLASALRELGRVDEAIAACERALQFHPDYAEAAWNLGLLKLLKGDFAQGWELYEARLRLSRPFSVSSYAQNRWNGSDLNGRRILLEAEQGFGDTIQFARYVPIVAGMGGQVILRCQPALGRLLRFAFPGIEVVANADPPPAFDVYSPLMSLPGLLGTRLETIPVTAPYLSVRDDLALKWRRRLGENGSPKVGLAWAGSRGNTNDRNRSINPAELGAAFREIPCVRFVSLQKHEPGTEATSPPLERNNFSDDLVDFAETAALIANLDLVISVDTAVAHLAGALGKPVWLLLPFAPDWRWMLGRSDSPWYPTMKLFRQVARGEWQPPLRQVAGGLKAMAGTER